jgi:hypothetical protein
MRSSTMLTSSTTRRSAPRSRLSGFSSNRGCRAFSRAFSSSRSFSFTAISSTGSSFRRASSSAATVTRSEASPSRTL